MKGELRFVESLKESGVVTLCDETHEWIVEDMQPFLCELRSISEGEEPCEEEIR